MDPMEPVAPLGGVTVSYYVDLNTTTAFRPDLNLPYTICEVIVAICAVLGNGLVITVFTKNKKLRRRTNYYIISLATADLLVGLFGIPFAVLASIGLPRNLYACLFTVSVLIVLCTISIFCLVAVSIDRYWAILYPMGYSRNVRTKTAIGIIGVCWIAGTLVGFLPLLGWNAGHKSANKCIFVEVMDYDYLVFLYFATIIFPAFLIAAFYAHIYRVVVKQMQQIMIMNPVKRSDKTQTSGTMLRLLGAAQKREVKATQNLSRIVIFFIICWFPLYTINCVQAFCPSCEISEFIMNISIVLSHLNSVGNPLLYAYHLKDFRAALKSIIYRSMTFNRREAKPEVKSLMVGRGSVSTQNPRKNFPVTRNLKSSLLRRATDGSIPSLERRVHSIPPVPSLNNSPARNSRKDLNGTEFCHDSSPKKIDSQILNSTKISGMELQTYKFPEIAKLVDEDMESCLNDSVFIIHADINKDSSETSSPRESVGTVEDNKTVDLES